MSQIGLMIAGRDPGFTTFHSLNWDGEDIFDVSYAQHCNAKNYYSVRLDGVHATYQLNLYPLQSSERQDVFHIGIRLPFNVEILDSNFQRVSPKTILDSVLNKLLDVGVLSFTFGTYSYNRTIPIPKLELSALLDSFQVKPAWGPSVVMTGDETNIAFIAASSEEIATDMANMRMWRSVASYSLVVLGDVQPNFRATDADRKAMPEFNVQIGNASGQMFNLRLGDEGTDFSSAQFGYDPDAYHEIRFKLTPIQIIKSWFGIERMQLPEGVYVQFDAMHSLVRLSFNPPVRKVDFKVRIEGDPENRLNPGDVLTTLGDHTGNKIPVPTSIPFSGAGLVLFRRNAKETTFLSGCFSLRDGCHFKYIGASLEGNEIVVKVLYAPPVVKKTEEKVTKTTPRIQDKLEPVTMNMNLDVKPQSSLLVIMMPVSFKVKNIRLVVKSQPSPGQENIISRELTFRKEYLDNSSHDENMAYLRAEADIPALITMVNAEFSLGEPMRWNAKGDSFSQKENGEYQWDIHTPSRGAIACFFDKLELKHAIGYLYYTVSAIVIAIVIAIGAFLLGHYFGDFLPIIGEQEEVVVESHGVENGEPIMENRDSINVESNLVIEDSATVDTIVELPKDSLVVDEGV